MAKYILGKEIKEKLDITLTTAIPQAIKEQPVDKSVTIIQLAESGLEAHILVNSDAENLSLSVIAVNKSLKKTIKRVYLSRAALDFISQIYGYLTIWMEAFCDDNLFIVPTPYRKVFEIGLRLKHSV